MLEQIKRFEQAIMTTEQALEQAAQKGAFGLKAATVVNNDWEFLKSILGDVLKQTKERAAQEQDVPVEASPEEVAEPVTE